MLMPAIAAEYPVLQTLTASASELAQVVTSGGSAFSLVSSRSISESRDFQFHDDMACDAGSLEVPEHIYERAQLCMFPAPIGHPRVVAVAASCWNPMLVIQNADGLGLAPRAFIFNSNDVIQSDCSSSFDSQDGALL